MPKIRTERVSEIVFDEILKIIQKTTFIQATNFILKINFVRNWVSAGLQFAKRSVLWRLLGE